MDSEAAGALVDAAPVGLLIVDEIGTITYMSKSTEVLTGYGYGDVVGHNIIEYMHQVAIEGVIESIGYIQEHTDVIMGPLSMGFIHADGDVRILETYATNHYDDPRLGGLVVAVRDSTLQYQVNDALALYTRGEPRDDVMRTFCKSLLGLPIRARAAIVDATTGVPVSNVRLPDDVFGPAPAGSVPRPWQQAVATGDGVFPADLHEYDAGLQAAVERAGVATVWAYPIAGPTAEGSPNLPAWCLVVGRLDGGESSSGRRDRGTSPVPVGHQRSSCSPSRQPGSGARAPSRPPTRRRRAPAAPATSPAERSGHCCPSSHRPTTACSSPAR